MILSTNKNQIVISLKTALRPYSQMEPRTRRQRLLDFYNRIQNSEENAKIKEEWGLQIQPNSNPLVRVNAYCIDAETLTFGGDNKLVYDISLNI